ncbi:uncharacterized protein LOC111628119 [Centruroides sculpturatus]|uniref:uncharacterized protein LOC111628119 n=1 Tax=Centruroides sculpturatus TaxID=218467 RepID=UPI000C6DC34B|nr:uncharacterized protein LOC111628119 [Centruroides sculpturatus]
MSGKRKPFVPSSPKSVDSEVEEDFSSGSSSARGKDGSKLVDYDDVGSPSGSSTASGPVYVRTPGFENHGHSVRVKPPQSRRGSYESQKDGKEAIQTQGQSSCKKKKNSIISIHDMSCLQEKGQTHKSKQRKEPLPMKLRALPQSFWQQPNNASNVSPAIVVPMLPPLFKHDTADDVTKVRPVTPPEEREKGSATSTRSEGSRIIRVSNTDLLHKLFDGINEKDKQMAPVVRRGRPKKIPSTLNQRTLRGEDPCLVSTATEGILPLLNLDREGNKNSTQTLTLVSIRDGDKSVTLPALNVEQNYSQMLSELVVRL